MKRLLPNKLSEKQGIILKAVYDYFGIMNDTERSRANQIALYLMGRKKGIELTHEEKNDMNTIRSNMTDKVYMENLLKPREGKKLVIEKDIETDCYTIKHIPLNYKIEVKGTMTLVIPSSGIERDWYNTDEEPISEAVKLAERICVEHFRKTTEAEKERGRKLYKTSLAQ